MRRHLHNRLSGLCLAAVFVAAVALPVVAQPDAPVVTELWVPVDDTSTTVLGEPIHWSGTVHLIVRIHRKDRANSTGPIEILTNAASLQGEGVSGRIYHAFGTDTTVFQNHLGLRWVEFNQKYSVRVKNGPQDPHQPSDPRLPIDFIVNVDPLGGYPPSSATIPG